MSNPPVLIKIKDVPALLDREYQITRNRTHIYSWIRKGVKGIKLKSTTRLAQLYTTKGWLDEFLSDTNG